MVAGNYLDAHNHLQEKRLQSHHPEIIQTARRGGVEGMVVNGTHEADWPAVAALAKQHPGMLCPSFGLHPWFVPGRSSHWMDTLNDYLALPGAVLGEIGLDGWKKGLPHDQQESVFIAQLRVAAEQALPVTIHGLKAWKWVYEVMQREPLPPRGFLLHSYTGPADMIAPFEEMGAYFSFCGAFAREDREHLARLFTSVPADRLLIETDAPDQMPPDLLIHQPLNAPDGGALNHPANLPAIYRWLARYLGEDETALQQRVRANFTRLFRFSPDAATPDE